MEAVRKEIASASTSTVNDLTKRCSRCLARVVRRLTY